MCKFWFWFWGRGVIEGDEVPSVGTKFYFILKEGVSSGGKSFILKEGNFILKVLPPEFPLIIHQI